MSKVKVYINNQEVIVPESYTVLEAARENDINIPTLCYLKDLNEVGSCRMCLVEVEGKRNLQASCVLPVWDGMKINTQSKRVRNSRKNTLELLLSNHNKECLSCARNNNCELQTLADEFGIDESDYENEVRNEQYDDVSPSIIRDSSKCILCGKCISVCKETQGVEILGFTNRGYETVVELPFSKNLTESPCLYCGQCVNVCPVGALTEKSQTDLVWDALENEEMHVVVQTAPAVRAALGEIFEYPIGTGVTGKMVSALKRLGFDKVFDTNFAADLTIMEEGYELLNRLNNGGKLPLITSCSPGWIRFCEFNHPEFIDNLSTCKSPQQMFGAIAKSYYAEKFNIDPNKIFVVSIMPCTSKKSECEREELSVNGLRDVDVVLTTRELGSMIKESRIIFNKLPDSKPDSILGEYTGAGVIFGATGGVMEAALRTVADVVTGKELKKLEYKDIRGMNGIKEAEIAIGDLTVKAAIVHGTANAEELLKKIKSGEKEYHFIEIMACPGGCVNGGGQPNVSSKLRNEIDYVDLRSSVLYNEDRNQKIRKSHKNPEIVELYDKFLDKPNSHKAHELLHTHYHKREKFKK